MNGYEQQERDDFLFAQNFGMCVWVLKDFISLN